MEEKQSSFVFYRSFLDAIKEMDETEQLAMFQAICAYALDGQEPVLTSAFQRAVFALIRPNIDVNTAKRQGGKRGGRPKTRTEKTTPSNSETIGFEDENHQEIGFETENHRFQKTENNVDVDEDVDEDAEFKEPGSRIDTGLAEIVQDYQQEIGSFPRSALEPLQAHRAAVGDAMIRLAIQEAAQHGAHSWSYVDGVLTSWRKEGVKTPGDVAARRERARRNKQPPRTPEPRYEVLT